MTDCPDCGERLRRLGDRLFQCPISLLYYVSTYGKLGPALIKPPESIVGRAEEQSEAPKKMEGSLKNNPKSGKPSKKSSVKELKRIKFPGGLSSDMIAWVTRISDALVPIKERDSKDARKRALAVREEIKDNFTTVLEGIGKFEDCFDKWRQKLNLHPMELTTILYNALEGLKSPEAIQLREQYGQAIQTSGYKD